MLQRIEHNFIARLEKAKPTTKAALNEAQHYDSARYRAINLNNVRRTETVEFRRPMPERSKPTFSFAETARLTESRPELDEQEQQAINECLAYIANHIKEQPEARIKYFVPDEHKSGGGIVEVSGTVKKISATDGTLYMTAGNSAAIRDIICISTK